MAIICIPRNTAKISMKLMPSTAYNRTIVLMYTDSAILWVYAPPGQLNFNVSHLP